MLDPKTGEHIYIQVKNGNVEIDADDYKQLQGITWLFTTKGRVINAEKPKDWELKEIGDIMNNAVVGWEKCKNQRYPEFGTQRSWRRIQNAEPVMEQLEITENFPVIEDTDLPAEWD